MDTLSHPSLSTPEIINEFGKPLTLHYENTNIKDRRLLTAFLCSGTIYLSTLEGRIIAGVNNIQHAPSANCGMCVITAPYCQPEFLKPLWLNILEAYLRFCGRSIVIASDRVGETVYEYIKKSGEGWHFSQPTINRNYDETRHCIDYDEDGDPVYEDYPEGTFNICFFWKNIGEFTYPDYGFVYAEDKKE